ncbi:unnamed protein product, partial [Allacma fusca]
DRGNLTKLGQQFNSNLLDGIVTFNDRIYKNTSCSLLKGQKNPHPWSCVHREIGTALNFTSRLKRNLIYSDKCGSCLGGVFGNKTSNELLMSRVNNFSMDTVYDVLVPGEIFNAHSFVWVLEPQFTRWGLLGAMGWACWLYTVFSVGALIGCVKFLRKTSGKTISSVGLIAPLLVEQGDEFPSFEILGKKAGTLVILWAFVAIVISNGYKGTLFSEMTAISFPKVPRNLEELASGDSPLITTSYFYSNASRKDSHLHNIIRKITEKGNSKKNITRILKDFGKKLIFTRNSTADLVHSLNYNGHSML